MCTGEDGAQAGRSFGRAAHHAMPPRFRPHPLLSRLLPVVLVAQGGGQDDGAAVGGDGGHGDHLVLVLLRQRRKGEKRVGKGE